MTITDYLSKNYIELTSLLIAVLSAYYAFRSNQISKKALRITESEYFNRQSIFQLYLVDNYRYILKDKKLLLFNISINNQSENPNSFKAVLEIEFIRDDNSAARVMLEHNSTLISEISKNDLTPYDNDIRLEGKSIKTSWLFFEQPKDLFERYKIEKYKIRIIDVQENEKQLEALFIKSIQI